MELTLVNFRRYKNKVIIDIKDGVTKISGPSGIGKTTIFSAIEWCLYGKLRKVKPIGHNGGTSVTMKMRMPADGNIRSWTGTDAIVSVTVHRESSTRVSLAIDEHEYQDHEAQARIDAIFGDSSLFRVTSYLRAEEMHPMLVATPMEKREITSLLFPDAIKHTIYKERIKRFRDTNTSALSDISVKQAKIDGIISTIEDHHPWVTTETPDEEVADIPSLEKAINDMKATRDRCVSIANRYSSLKVELESIPDVVDMEDQEKERDSIKDRIQQSIIDVASREAMESSIRQQLESIDIDGIPSESECKTAISDCMSIKRMGLDSFNGDDIVKLEAQVSTLKEQLSKCGHTDGREYECPGCALSLYVLDGNLVQEKPNVDPSIDRASLVRRITTLEYRISNIKEAMEKFPSYEGKDIGSILDTMNDHINKRRAYSNLEDRLKAIPPIPDTYITPDEASSLKKRLHELDAMIMKNMANRDRRDHILATINSMEDEHQWLHDEAHIPSMNVEIEKKVATLKAAIATKRRMDIVAKYKDTLEAKRKLDEAKNKIDSNIANCARLDAIVDEVYHHYVGTMLKSVEHDISELAKIMFDRTMNITLTPTKVSKSGIMKPSFDMNIQYDGVDYDDVKSMSTGEKKRLSIVLMIVLTKYTDGKMLLLDEALTSVGMEHRGLIMNELTKMGIPILITSHDDIPDYDNDLQIQ